RAYVYADQSGGLAGLLSGQSLTEGVAQRSGYTAVAFGASLDTAGDVKVALQDMERARATVQLERDKAAKLTKTLASRREAVDEAIADQQRVLSSVKGELVELVRLERVRREQEAARAAQAALAAAQRAAAQRAAARRTPVAGRAPGSAQPGSPSAPAGPKPGSNVPPPAAGAAAAVRFALSQLGVPYHYAMSQPGVGFDCSGLMVWAWGRAGVSLPRSSRAQAAALPSVSLADIQPGDLIFSHNPVGHVGMYIGNGQMVHSPRTGEVVNISAISRRIVKIGRPG
ncbi:MAG TPA: C40 family peptidase, partial [Acidimicrobiales bacterium]